MKNVIAIGRLRSLAALLILAGAQAQAQVAQDPLGIERLRSELGERMFDGRGVDVAQVEPPSRLAGEEDDSPLRTHAPDRDLDEFAGIVFHNTSSDMAWGSAHATMTGRRLYGRSASMARGVTDVWLYTANDFLRRLAQPERLASARVWSHSWVGSTRGNDGLLLRALDKAAQRYDWLVAVGVANKDVNSPLLASAYDVLSVGRSDGGHARGAARVDRIYSGTRARPHLVVPASTASEAVPVVASAAAVLIQAGRQSRAASDDAQPPGNAERALTVRAALMAGASRQFDRGVSASVLLQPSYRGDDSVRTDNGLDSRFGAGQLNIYNSYHIIAGGETDSVEDDTRSPPITGSGFDFDANFGGAAGANKRARYRIAPPANARLVAALIWPVRRDGVTRVDDLDLVLYDATEKLVVVASSTGRSDTGEHFVADLDGTRRYQLVVRQRSAKPFDAPYALAWHLVRKSDAQGQAVGSR